MRCRIASFIAPVAAFLALAAQAQPMAEVPDMAIDAATRASVIAGALEALDQRYVFPEVAAKAVADVKRRDAAGEYAAITSAKALAKTLTDDLQGVAHDKHLRVIYRPAPQAGAGPGAMPMPGPRGNSEAFQKSVNYGYEKAERLLGNVGLIEVRSFGTERAGTEVAVAAAMAFLAHTDALIIDVRRNGGGDPEMVALLCSYLFDERTHLNDLYWREGARTEEFWTRDLVAGPRYGMKKPVFVLTSKRTFSGAEEFANNLKVLKRATIVGETTGGGANPGGVQALGERFEIFVPTGRAINPVTKTNWEGTGVEPDVAVPADQALDTARELALKALGRPVPVSPARPAASS